MFDFTTTTFVHNADMIEANPNASAHSENSENYLRIGYHLFKYEDVAAIYRHPYTASRNAKLIVDIDGFMASQPVTENQIKRFKLDFYLRRSGDNNPFYSNDFVFKGKDFHYEWTNKENTAKKVAKMINKIIRLYGDVYLNVYVGKEGDEKNKLVFENDNYGWFSEAQLKGYVPELSDCCTYREGMWDVIDELGTDIEWCGENSCDEPSYPVTNSIHKEDGDELKPGWLVAQQGVEGNGTYQQLLKDLRLPTLENMRWLSPTTDEMPLPGTKYVQYTFHQIACRGVLGGSAVGEVTHSKTTHVFFVPTCGCGDDLDNLMQQAIEDAGMKDLMLTTIDKTNGMAGNGVVSDKVTDPAIAEAGKFVHDLTKKAKTSNSDEHSAKSGSESGGNGGNGGNSGGNGGTTPSGDNQEPANP